MLIDNDQDENDGVAIRFSIYQSISLKDLLECIRNIDDKKVATMIIDNADIDDVNDDD